MNRMIRIAMNNPYVTTYRHRAGAVARAAAMVGIAIAVAACAPTDRKPATRSSSWAEQAERDPSNFKPPGERYDISGGGIADFDSESFKKDVDHVLNP